MKYFLLNATFVDNHVIGELLDKAINEHLAYLNIGIKSGSILFSGPKVGVEGGVIVIKCKDFNGAEQFCKLDPIVKAGIQQYEIIEFKCHTSQPDVKKWFA